MNVTACYEKEKDKEARTSKRRAGEERRQATNFKEAAWCATAVVHEAARQKNKEECPG